LAAGYTLIIDIFHPSQRLPDLDQNEERAETLLLAVRIAILIVAIVAVWGTQQLVQLFDKSLFEFVYIVIIPQLALMGPVLASLLGRTRGVAPIWIAIVAGLVAGFSAAVGGTALELSSLSDGAGILTVLFSVLVSFISSKRRLQGAREP